MPDNWIKEQLDSLGAAQQKSLRLAQKAKRAAREKKYAEEYPKRLKEAREQQSDLSYQEAWDALMGLQEEPECCEGVAFGGGSDAQRVAFAEAVVAAIIEEHAPVVQQDMIQSILDGHQHQLACVFKCELEESLNQAIGD